MKPGKTPGNVGFLTNKELSQMLFSLPGPNTETELARGDPGEVAEEAGRDPAGRGKQAAIIFTLLRLQGFLIAALQRREFPLGLAQGQGTQTCWRLIEGLWKLQRGGGELSKPSGQAAWVGFHSKKGSFVEAAAQGGQRPSPHPRLWRH